MPDLPIKTYLGDSVYAEYDGHMIRLYTDNGNAPIPSMEIYLEFEVYRNLTNWVDTMIVGGRNA